MADSETDFASGINGPPCPSCGAECVIARLKRGRDIWVCRHRPKCGGVMHYAHGMDELERARERLIAARRKERESLVREIDGAGLGDALSDIAADLILGDSLT